MVVTRCDQYYTGIARDLAARFEQHLATFQKRPGARGAKYFRGREPLQIVYYEKGDSRSWASHREYSIKRLSKRQKTALTRTFLEPSG